MPLHLRLIICSNHLENILWKCLHSSPLFVTEILMESGQHTYLYAINGNHQFSFNYLFNLVEISSLNSFYLLILELVLFILGKKK